ncbi:MAG: hypothetical protein PHE26_06130, partial [Syntrophomonadaceae bacterium]|nr:hypothetical protein [Syntrophomonadaceae bacterium]
MKPGIRKLPGLLLIFCTALFMLSMMQLPAQADPSYYITNDGSDFQVSGGSSYSTLTEALSHCTGDGSQVIQLGTAGTPLQVVSADFELNTLRSGTYTGYVQINCGSRLTGLGIGNSPVKFEDLTISTVISDSKTHQLIDIAAGNTLSICGNTSISYDGKGFCIYNLGTLSMSGGTINNSGTGKCLRNDGTALISSGIMRTDNSSADTILNNKDLTISGNATVSSSNDGIINAETLSALTINGGTITQTGTEGSAVFNDRGTINMTGGRVETTSASGLCFGISGGGNNSITISGGTVSCASSESDSAAICHYAWRNNPASALIVSDNAVIESASNNIVIYYNYYGDSARSESMQLFGKTIHGAQNASIAINGVNSGSNKEIKAANYTNATLNATNIINGESFICWTSDSGLNTTISTTNGDTVSNLTTGANAAVTDIYLKTGLETQPAGTGADGDNPYLITTAGNLLWMSQNCTTQSGFSGKYFKQTANIDLTGLGEFVPIGSMSNPFKGRYDGNNHKILKLYIHGSYSETGLLGDLKEGTIKNLTLEDVSISGNNWAVAGF